MVHSLWKWDNYIKLPFKNNHVMMTFIIYVDGMWDNKATFDTYHMLGYASHSLLELSYYTNLVF